MWGVDVEVAIIGGWGGVECRWDSDITLGKKVPDYHKINCHIYYVISCLDIYRSCGETFASYMVKCDYAAILITIRGMNTAMHCREYPRPHTQMCIFE